jgi:hypothetical protein
MTEPLDPFGPTPPEPVDGCEECAELARERRAARKAFDHSKVTDCDVLLRAHQALRQREAPPLPHGVPDTEPFS